MIWDYLLDLIAMAMRSTLYRLSLYYLYSGPSRMGKSKMNQYKNILNPIHCIEAKLTMDSHWIEGKIETQKTSLFTSIYDAQNLHFHFWDSFVISGPVVEQHHFFWTHGGFTHSVPLFEYGHRIAKSRLGL